MSDTELESLRKKAEEEDAAFNALLSALDALASFPLPAEQLPDLANQKERLNALWEMPARPAGSGLGGAFRARAWDAVAPALERQQAFNAALVQLLNGHLDASASLHARLRDVVATLMRFLQRVLPLIDARDRLASALSTTRSELVLEAFDRRQESLSRRLDGLVALRDRLDSLSEETRAIGASLRAQAPQPIVAAQALRAAEGARYVAFENRFRGPVEEIRERLAEYVRLFEGCAPVADLGCGRGEFLALLGEAGIESHGVESNPDLVRSGLERGLDVMEADLLAFLQEQADGSLGGIFAAQVAEHLPPAALSTLLREAHRVLRPGGLLVIETVNPRSAFAFLEAFNRDLSHEKPLHPETLSFLAASLGFSDVRIEMKNPLDAAARLQPVPMQDLPARAAGILNENIERLNAFLYGPQDYALVARR
jgi:SAM-dependent methyltransferase